uniref:Uncharacterized protein n=1 Tax=Phanerochaete carnosa TaxID=231932 RepID=A0A895KUC9_9APHY|nr:hypothetical protein K8K84_mgp063 [Phanerochaete carnosa]QRZ60389.1 hypothetical protein [Phanerochaete carnosa]
MIKLTELTGNINTKVNNLGGNDNLIGTVIAIRKNLKKSNFEKYIKSVQEQPNKKHYIPEGYAVMLYFDHRLARIVRHLFNPNLTFWGKKTWGCGCFLRSIKKCKITEN